VAEEIAVPPAGRNLKDILRYVAGVALGIVVLLLLFGKRAEFAAAWQQIRGAAGGWLAAAAAAESTSLWLYARLQHSVLRLAGASLALPGLFLLTLANDAISCTVPGEPAVSSAYRYRYYRRHGATSAGAGWTIFTVLVAQAIGMSLILLLGVVVALAGGTNGPNTRTALAGLVIIVAAIAILVRRDLVLRLAIWLVRVPRRIARQPVLARGDDPRDPAAVARGDDPPDPTAVARGDYRPGPAGGGGGARVEGALERMRQIPLGAWQAAWVVLLAAGVWLADFGCLLCAFRAVHAPIPWNGVLLAYCVAEIAGMLPIVPGGIGIVEGSLAAILAAYGASHADALAAALGFRLISFWLAIAVGWVSVAAIARRRGQRPAFTTPE